jgi:glycosyltransferase involved in cell wall biosynthesis
MSVQRDAGQLAAPVAAPRIRPLHVVAVGISAGETCGVLDHATLLAEALGRLNISCSLHWLQRTNDSLLASRAEVRAWARSLTAELDEGEADAILLHYSVFKYSFRGIPIFVRPVFTAARRSRVPVITLLHEFVFPWTLAGLQGKLWAVSQRMRLIGVINASAAVAVTTQRRAEWVESRRWLARRRLAVVPVFSNLPAASAAPQRDLEHRVLGLFGYAYGEATVQLVLDALHLLQERGLPVRLVLLGAPGARSASGERWLERAREHGVVEALWFSGTLSAQELSDRLAACEILLFADPAGPTSRKTTLAASLASARPVVALDGPQRWNELIEDGAARVVAPTAQALAGALELLLGDEQQRASLGARGRDFAERMGLARSAQIVAGLLEEIVVRPA